MIYCIDIVLLGLMVGGWLAKTLDELQLYNENHLAPYGPILETDTHPFFWLFR